MAKNPYDYERKQYAANLGIRGALFLGTTLGQVVSTDDPQQMGRLYVHCVELGDPPNLTSEDFTKLPLCTYCSPLAGSTDSRTSKGPDDDSSTVGQMAYGMWSIPKVGSTVAVVCVDGNPSQRLWIGCVFDQLVTNTLPHGRYNYSSHSPDGPLSSTERPIQPMYDNMSKAFTKRDGNFEWRSRGADYQTANVTDENLEASPSNKPDDTEHEVKQEDGTTLYSTQGYATSRNKTFGGQSLDSQVYSWTTPGFHSISMDDRVENCRFRIRTVSGKQILLDDTNERIYISTAQGNVWLEMDEDGSLDIFCSESISFHGKHINLMAEETIRMYAKTGIHSRSDTDIRFFAKENIDSIAKGDIRETSDGTNETLAGKNIVETGEKIHMNGPAATKAKDAVYVNRTPEHEPWGRTTTKDGTTIAPKYSYNDPMIGRENIKRGKNWRR